MKAGSPLVVMFHLPLAWLQRRTLELTGKSRKKGAVQSELARICNVPHKNFFIVVKASTFAAYLGFTCSDARSILDEVVVCIEQVL